MLSRDGQLPKDKNFYIYQGWILEFFLPRRNKLFAQQKIAPAGAPQVVF